MRFFISTILGLMLTFFTLTVSSAPFLYTFSGNIEFIELDGVYLSDIDFDNDYSTPEDTFTVGEEMEYTFLVDFDLAGFCAGPLGTTYSSTCTGVDIPDSATADYFFTDLIAAKKVAAPTEEGTTFNFGLNLSNLGSLTADSAIFIRSPFNEPVTDWVAASPTSAGTVVLGTDGWAAPNGNSPYGRITSKLTLTSIKPFTKGCIPAKNKGEWESKVLAELEASLPDNEGNLIENSGFESGDTEGWSVRSKSRTHVVNRVIGEGNYSLSLRGNPDCWVSVVQFVKDAMTGGQTYRFSGSISVSGRTKGEYVMQVRWFDADGREFLGSRNMIVSRRHNNEHFKTHSADFIAPDNAVSASIFLMAGKADGVAYFDSISAVPVN